MHIIIDGLSGLRAQEGRVIGSSAWLAIDQARIDAFGEATDDRQWIHVDAERARQGPFGSTIAHGYLTLSLLPALHREIFTIQGFQMALNYGLEKVRFPVPVTVGSRIRASVTLSRIVEISAEWVQAEWTTVIDLDGSSKPACVATTVGRYKTS